ncbi:MAG: hypothetical protein GY904_09275 [Planctomycetaceae bacterium]|nr:hypothetical protein [Planctomycetaceae bacterium]
MFILLKKKWMIRRAILATVEPDAPQCRKPAFGWSSQRSKASPPWNLGEASVVDGDRDLAGRFLR